MRGRLMVATTAVAGLLLGACGSDGGQLSADGYVDEANEVCQAANEALEQELEPVFVEIGDNLVFSGEDPTEQQLEQVVDALIDSVRNQIDEIRELDGPPELEAEVDEVLDATGRVIDEIAAGTPQEYFESGQAEFSEVDAQFQDLGLSECG